MYHWLSSTFTRTTRLLKSAVNLHDSAHPSLSQLTKSHERQESVKWCRFDRNRNEVHSANSSAWAEQYRSWICLWEYSFSSLSLSLYLSVFSYRKKTKIVLNLLSVFGFNIRST